MFDAAPPPKVWLPPKPSILRSAPELVDSPEQSMLPGITPVLGTKPKAWKTTSALTYNTDSNGWSGFTVRQRFEAAGLSNIGGVLVRVTMGSSAGQGGFTIGNAYIGHAAATGNAYDFETSPTQLLFGGAAGTTIAQNTSIVTDGAAFTIRNAQALLVSIYFSGASSVRGNSNTVANVSAYFKNANEAAAVVTSGYTFASAGSKTYLITLVESFV